MWLYKTNEDNTARYILGQINEEKGTTLLNTFTGNQGNRERIHRSTEGYAMMLSAGAEIVPSRLPKLQREVIQNTFENKQGYTTYSEEYLFAEIKKYDYEL